jgi:GNAT superfamily N-acetyltransferase
VETLVTTYLQTTALPRRRSEVGAHKFRVEELIGATSEKLGGWRFNREMYFKVGEQWKWIDKRPWTDAQWKDWANDPKLRTFAGYCSDEVAGYFELHRYAAGEQRSEDSVEIAYFGLLPEFIGRGLGGALLTNAIEKAWAWAPTPSRVWVHTCNRDHPNALANYQARGFKVYKTVTCDT